MAIITSYVDPAKDTRVYGTPIAEYAIDGEQGKSFAEVVAFASLRQANAVEQVSVAVSDVVRERQKKVDDLGFVLATLAEAMGSMDTEEQDPDKRWSAASENLVKANELLELYGLKLLVLDDSDEKGCRINYRNAQPAQNDVQKYLDDENSDLKQNMAFLEGLVGKRDNSFTVANRVVSRINGMAVDTIDAIGE